MGKTSLTYHISWMLSQLGYNTLSVDLDPQANLTGMFLQEDRFEQLLNERKSLFYSLKPLIDGEGDIKEPFVFSANDKLGLLIGDLNLSSMEYDFSQCWPQCLDRKARAFRVTTAFSRLIALANYKRPVDWAVIDIGPNLGAVNRAVLIASDYVLFPLSPDLFSFQGLKNVGQFLNEWREEWRERMTKAPADLDFKLPSGKMAPAGYIMMRHSIRYNRPVQAYQRWMDKMPTAYRQNVLKEDVDFPPSKEDKYLLAYIKDYRSLMPMAQESNKPVFLLKPGDGAIGSHYQACQEAYKDFKLLAKRILSVCDSS